MTQRRIPGFHGHEEQAAARAAGLMLMRAYRVPEVEARRISRLPLPRLPDVPLRTAVINHFQIN